MKPKWNVGGVTQTATAQSKTIKEGLRVLAIKHIEADERAQPRLQMDPGTIADYAEAMIKGGEDNGHPFPAVVVFTEDDRRFFLADGFHRLEAAKNADLRAINADVRRGSLRDAILFAVKANAGLRLTDGDKRRAVLLLLNDDDWSQWSNVRIAQECHVSESYVRKIKDQKEAASSHSATIDEPEPSSHSAMIDKKPDQKPQPTIKVKRGGKTYDMKKRDKPKPKPLSKAANDFLSKAKKLLAKVPHNERKACLDALSKA